METILDRTNSIIISASNQAYEKLLAILIVVAGWVVAAVFLRLCVKLLGFFAVDKLVAKTPLDHMLKGIGIGKSVSEILGILVFWTTILITLIFASEILNLQKVSKALETVTSYIPQVIAAFLIIVFGMLLARFLQTVIVQSLSRTQIGYERSIGRAVQIIVLVFVFLAAIEQLGINLSFITTNVLIIVGAILLVIGLSIVLGARTVLENSLACQHLKRHLKTGSKIKICGTQGAVSAFTFSGVIIDTQEGKTVVPATAFFENIYTIS